MINLEVTSIPDLIRLHGSLRAAVRNTGISQATIQRYQTDFKCEGHVIINGRLMFSRTNTVHLTKHEDKCVKWEFVDNVLVKVDL